ncbi:hypothetical protein [Flammeovirga aprica]|uniref:Uncharacterized protein n=1 Tax=Flammeovirga aprica JL-4 TaxID=694437 RepID=A0A7X9P068_9BACT|nr:hypothetical protein [Flammeovirga aprica]NME66592.1 hypothetical protein [Flammeovirga aprica JL-4]
MTQKDNDALIKLLGGALAISFIGEMFSSKPKSEDNHQEDDEETTVDIPYEEAQEPPALSGGEYKIDWE